MFAKFKNLKGVLKYLKYNLLIGLGLMMFTSLSVGAQSNDLNLLPAYDNIFDFLLEGVIQGFLLPLAPIVGLLAIVWGGYQYYFGSFTGKSDGMKAIQSGVIGIAIFSGYSIFIDVTSGTTTGLIPSLFADGGITAEPLIAFIQDTLLNNFLYALAGIVAVLAMVYGGYQYVTSPFSKEAGLKTIQNAAIGLAIILLASVAKNFITATFENETINKDPFISLAQQVVSNFLLPVSSVVTLIFVVYGSYQWMTAQEPSQVKDAQKTLKNALIGLVIVIASFSITQLIVYIVTNLNIGQ
jgi:hypothetical protein